MFFRFAYVEILYILLPAIIGCILFRLLWYKRPYYIYPLTGIISHEHLSSKNYHKHILFALRALGLIGLGLMIARPQMVDERSLINVDGVDIVLTLDVSGSMGLIDDLNDKRDRFQVAKDEAIRFIDKRINDPIGVVIFAHDVLSYSPLTLDKYFLKQLVGSMQLGIVNPNGTSLGTGLATAVNRLKTSKAKSKIAILLTDGQASPETEKIDTDTALELAKKFGIKVYTIGVGNEKRAFIKHHMFGLQPVQAASFNKPLLENIAQQTGGQFFHAHNPADMRKIYDTIDKLEKTSYETNIFHNYYELFLSFMWIVLIIIGCELLLRLFIWRGMF